MIPGHITTPPGRPLLYAALAYGLFIFLMLPPGVIAINDDFGYLRSVVETLQRGRPWTDDWLEPWAAGFSSLSALLFLATGSFYCATYGLLGLLGAVSFYAAARLLRDRGFTNRRAILLATLGLTIPTIFWKSLEFTGVALYLPGLLLALRAATPWISGMNIRAPSGFCHNSATGRRPPVANCSCWKVSATAGSSGRNISSCGFPPPKPNRRGRHWAQISSRRCFRSMMRAGWRTVIRHPTP